MTPDQLLLFGMLAISAWFGLQIGAGVKFLKSNVTLAAILFAGAGYTAPIAIGMAVAVFT